MVKGGYEERMERGSTVNGPQAARRFVEGARSAPPAALRAAT
jgi:hypothetical protein